jgi:peptidoglycan hydrolase-like protein with peptidoglycan-binding domain
MSAKRKAAGAVAVVAVGGATAAAVAFGLPGTPSEQASASAMPPATAAVTRQTLVDQQDKDGKLGYGDQATIAARLAGTLTMVPAVGRTVTRGKPLFKVDNTPVVLLYGSLPAYRTLAPGVEGADVKQFERNLWALGYRGFTVDDTYSSATATAVRKWQKDLGLTRTGSVETSRIVYAAGAIRVDERKAEPGDQLGPGAAVLTATETSRIATVDLDVADERLAKVGATVQVTLPDGTVLPGKITDAETIIVPGEGQQPDTTSVEVTIGFPAGKRPQGLDQASVTVAFTAAQRKDVLTVPVAALLALAEGGYGVQVVDGATTKIVAVQTGLFASGRVEVTGGGLADGTVVGMPA